jgi:hypothetical protein
LLEDQARASPREILEQDHHFLQLRTLDGARLTNVWDGSWRDAETGAAMTGFGIEVWTMREGRIAAWEAAFNAAPAASATSLADMLR